MSTLQYRLSSGTDPRGKQKIYFCCHPDDFDAFFPKICEDVFRKEDNCVIFYEAAPREGYDREDLLFQLCEMQLFIVPVTKKLLTESSRALELELPFALGKIAAADGVFRHIAVLPVLFGDGLTDLFNRTEPFLGLQYLERYSQDTTALSYEEKLKRYLKSVLISRAEDERIRAEFKAGIFLSYRKIDRALARKLMQTIHSHDLCRDVSIWYDEYLVPGESWEDAIHNALAGSDLFVLNVTPRLLQPGNYVWEKEYPNALRSGKPILPVITEAADLGELKSMYERIEQQLIAEGDTEGLEKGLIWGLVSKAGKKQLLTPDDRSDHLYYMGLAYKNSVGVETDTAKAVRLLEDAGERGCRTAFLTLGRMYEHGDGVAKDEQKAIAYYDRFIALQKPDFGTSKEGDLNLLLAYDAKGMIHINNSRLNDAFDTFRELNELLDAMTSCFGSFKQINLPISYERLGSIKKALGDSGAAQKYYQKAMDVRLHPTVTTNIATAEDRAAEADAAGYNERHMKLGLAVNLYSMGELNLTNRDLAAAETNMLKANQLFVELAKAQEDRDLLINLSKSHMGVARVQEAKGDVSEAEASYEKALETLKTLCQDPKDQEAKSLRVVTNILLAGLYRDMGRLQRAYVMTGEALADANKLAAEDPHPRMQTLLATAYERMGTIEEMLGNYDKARMWYKNNIDLSERIATGTEDAEFQRSQAIAYEKMAKLLTREEEDPTPADISTAVKYLLKDLDITRKLAGSEPDLQAQRDLSVCYDALYNAYLYVDATKALEYGVRGLQLAFRLADQVKEPQELYELGISYYDVGRLCADISPLCFRNALKLWSAAYRASGSPEIKGRIDMLRKLMNTPNPTFPLGPGFCTGLNECVRRWPEGAIDGYDFENPLPGGAPPQSPAGGGCLWALIPVALILGAILQLTGLFDVLGFLRDKLSKPINLLLVAILAALCFLPLLRGKKHKKGE